MEFFFFMFWYGSLLPAVVWFLVRRHRLLLVCLASRPQFEHNGAPLVFISRRMMPVGALLWGRHPWAASQWPENVCRLHCFAAVGRQLLRTMVSTPTVSLMLREREAWPRRGLCGQRRVPRGFLGHPHSTTDSVRKGFVSQLKLPMKHRKGKHGASSVG